MKYLLGGVLLFLILGTIFFFVGSWTAAETPPPADPKPARLEVIGTGPSGPLRIGERFRGEFRLKNAGAKDVWVVGSLDGSSFGRPPVCLLEIRDDAGQLQEVPLPGVCGTWDPLGEFAFKNLKPGEVLERPLESILPWWRPTQPGTYTLILTYDSSSPNLNAWAGDTRRLSPRCRELLALVPKGKFISNPVRITVVP